MSESNNDDRPTSRSAPDGEPAEESPLGGGTDGAVRMWISGALFVLAAVVTFIAGDDNRWVSIPGAIVAAVALVDFLSVNQRRRRSE